jgi:putative DNA primase/helicase
MDRAIRRSEVNIENLAVKWIWEPYIPLRFCTLIGADGGVGKSRLALWLSKQLSQGALSWPTSAQTLFIDLEGMAVDLMIKASAWQIPIEYPVFYGELEEGIPVPGAVDVAAFGETATECDARLIVIDSWSQYAGEKDANKQETVIKLMQPLQLLARNCNAAVVILAHNHKGIGIEESPNAKMIRGSGSLYEQSRSVLILQSEEEGDFTMHHVKSNLGPIGNTIMFEAGDEGEPNISTRKPTKTIERTLLPYKRLALELAREGSTEQEIRLAVRSIEGAPNNVSNRAIQFLRKEGYQLK